MSNNTDSKQDEVLLPCPFCGRKAGIDEFRRDDDPQPLFAATCEICPVKTYDQFSAGEAARIWNSRSLPELVPEFVRVQDVLRTVSDLCDATRPFVGRRFKKQLQNAIHAVSYSRASVPAVGGDALAKAKAIVEEYKQRVMQLPSGDAVPCAKWLETRLRIAFDLAAAPTEPPMCAVHAELDGEDKLILEVGNGCIACSLHERTALLNLLEPFAADDASQDSLTVLRNLIKSAAASSSLPAEPPQDEQCDAFQPSILGVPEPEDRCVKVKGHEGKHSRDPRSARRAYASAEPLQPESKQETAK